MLISDHMMAYDGDGQIVLCNLLACFATSCKKFLFMFCGYVYACAY